MKTGNGIRATKIRSIVEQMRREADNISREADNICPIHDDGKGGEAHPAPFLRRLASRLEAIAEGLSDAVTLEQATIKELSRYKAFVDKHWSLLRKPDSDPIGYAELCLEVHQQHDIELARELDELRSSINSAIKLLANRRKQ